MLAIAASAVLGALVLAGPAQAKPNVVLIQLDDQPASMFTEEVMPRTFARIVDPGTRFSNYFTVAPTCCPSRATLLTGEYPHNHGVLSNSPGYRDLLEPGNILPAWLQRAGYTTAHVGKYLNNYGKAAGERTIPKGWDRWVAALEPRRYYDYKLTVGHRRVRFGSKPRDHLTGVLSRKAAGLARSLARHRKPFFLAFDQFAPHKAGGGEGRCKGAAVPGPMDVDRFEGEPLPQDSLPKPDRSLNEQDVSDKPPFVAGQPLISAHKLEQIRERHACAMAASYTADRGVAKVFEAVRRSGELAKTVFIYISDNGLFYGEHRVPGEKQLPYDEIIRQPMAVRMPPAVLPGGGPGPETSTVMAANIDIAPTILDLANARPCRTAGSCRTLDGRSLLGPLAGSFGAFGGRRLLVEYDLGRKSSRERIACKFAAVRTKADMYARYQQVVKDPGSDDRRCRRTLQIEHYDMGSDPLQLNSLWAGGKQESAKERSLRRTLSQLRRCAGISGRDHRTGGRPFCD